MNEFGFLKVAAAIPEVKVADCEFNKRQILHLIHKAVDQEVEMICFPELCITAYTCADLFYQKELISSARESLQDILANTRTLDITFILGLPLLHGGKLYNTAAVCSKGKVLGYVPKTYLPNHGEFYEKRWFVSALDSPSDQIDGVPFGTDLLFGGGDFQFAVEICEDLWTAIPPSSIHCQQGASLIFNLSASNELVGKNAYRKSLIRQQSARCIAGYVYASAGWGESTTDTVYSGNAFIYENGNLLAESERFRFEEQLIVSEIDLESLQSNRMRNSSFGIGATICDSYRMISEPVFPSGKSMELTRKIGSLPFVPPLETFRDSCEEIFSIQIGGLAKRMNHTGCQKLVLGISGGLDSTLALLVCLKTCDKLGISRKNIIGITMPGFGTTNRTYRNALQLMDALGITSREISIAAACNQHFQDIGHDPSIHDITFENTQARERTQILMDVANQECGLVIGTGDLSELALGWATYNGDHISMYGVNTGVPKTLVRHLLRWVAENQVDEASEKLLLDIIDTPISPELVPSGNGEIEQKTEDIVGPYELHDFFLYYTVRYGYSPSKILFLAKYAFGDTFKRETILKWMTVFFKRFFSQQFKRSCMPDGPKIGSINLSPRGDWRMPSDASASLWLKEIESLQ